MSLKLGIIGYGKMASGWHAKIPTQLPEVDLVAVHDIDPERVAAARADGYRAYDSLGDFLKDEEVNFVLVATPNDFHKPLAIAVMEAGKNVMVEKPATLSARDWEEMMAVSSRTGRVLTVHHNRRWDLDYQTAKKIISEGFIGKPHAISSTYQLWMPGRKLSGLRWRDIPEHGGGLFYDWGVHLCDQLLNLYPEDPIVSVYMQMRKIHKDYVDNFSKLEMQTRSGLLLEMNLDGYATDWLPRWRLYGDLGVATIEDFGGKLGKITTINYGAAQKNDPDGMPVEAALPVIAVKDGITSAPESELQRDSKGSAPWVELYRNLADVVDNGAELIVKPEQVLRTMKLLDAAFQSARTGEVIHTDI